MTEPVPYVPYTVRGTPADARGYRGALDAGTVLDLGALAAANSMSLAQVTKFLDAAQDAALAAVLAAAPRLLRHSRQIAQAKINEVSMRIDRLQRRVMLVQQTGWRQLLAPPLQQLEDSPAYVSLAEVQSILRETLASLIINEE